MMHLPTTITAAPAPTNDTQRRAHAAAADIWARIDSKFDTEVDFWATRKQAFRYLFAMTRYMLTEECNPVDEVGWWLNAELTGGYDCPAIDQHKPEDLLKGLDIIRLALLKGIMPVWLSEATGLYPQRAA